MSQQSPGDARIVDRGYRHYDGVRTGVSGAVRAVTIHSIQRALGLRRTLWAKVLPLAGVAIAYVPAIVFVGMVALFPVEDLTGLELPSYGDYYGYIIAAIMVFVSLVAPEVLCTDRRSGMLGVYLSSPLDRDTYLIGKAAAIAGVLSMVCLGPPLLMLVANILQSQGPEGAAEMATTLFQVLAAGIAVTLLFTGVTMGVASLTDRKAVASAGIILLFLVSLMVTGILASVLGGPYGDEAEWLGIGSPTTLSLDLGSRIHGERSNVMPEVGSVLVAVGWFVWTVGGFALARYRLHALPVTR